MTDICDVPVISEVCDSAGEAAGSLVAAPFDWLAESMGNAAKTMFETVWQVIDTTTLVDVTSSEFTDVYSILFGVAVFIMLGFFALQVIGAMIRREPAALSRGLLGLAKSILGSFVALTLLAAALEITDQLCIGIVHAAGTNMAEMGDRIALLAIGLTGLSVAPPGAGSIITIFLGSLALAAAAMVWISLLIRKTLLLIAIVFAPIALAGASWDHTRGWVSKWATFVIALIVSKVVVVVIFLLATAQVSAPIDADLASISEPISGVVLMLVAAFAPYMAYKAISFMGFDTHQAMSSEQEMKSALNRPLPSSLHSPLGSRDQGPPKVLGKPSGSGASGARTQPPSTVSGGGAAGAGTGSTGAGAGGAAAGGAAAGAALAAKKAADAGPGLGSKVGDLSSAHASASDHAPPPAAQGSRTSPPSPVSRPADHVLDGRTRSNNQVGS